MKYYITGANGFIGQHVCEYLKDEDVFKAGLKIDPYKLRHTDVIIHLAAYGNHATQTNISEIILANITRLQDLLQFIRNCDFKKFYNISTSSVTLPIQTPYSASKFIGEEIVKACNDRRIVNVRPYSVYGPGEASHRFIPTVIRHLITREEMQLDEDATHDWIFVEDFIAMMFAGHTNIGSGVQLTNLQVVRILEQITGKTLNYKPVRNIRPYDTSQWVCPEILQVRSLYEGLKETYDRTA